MIAQPGDAWGPHSLQFHLPAVKLQLHDLSALQLDLLKQNYADFVIDAAPGLADHHIECHCYRLEHAPALSPHDLTLEGQYAPRQMWRNGGIDLTGINFEARIVLNPATPHTPSSLGVVHEHELVHSNVIENFMRVSAAHSALRQCGVVLHSAGLVFDEQAYIFSGRSNAGKTTLTRKAHRIGARVLSDDINLLLPGVHGYAAYAVPFTGEFGRTLNHKGCRESYPVACIVLLEQGDELKIEVVKPSAAVARLLTGCPFVNTDAHESEALFDAVTALVAGTPVLRLFSRRDDSIDEIMHTVMSTNTNRQDKTL